MLRELRVYDASGAKRFMLVDHVRFIEAFQAHLKEHEHTVLNAALNAGLEAAVFNPDMLPDTSDRDFYAPPRYSKMEILLERPPQPFEIKYTQHIIDTSQTLWGRILLWVMEYCERKLNGGSR